MANRHRNKGCFMKETDSLTNLLKSNNANISAVKANKILLTLGLLAEKERPSSKNPNQMKKFKALTEKGLQFGVNKENMSNPEETSPYYFTATFPELLQLISAEQ
jgi:hypothetical protein